MSNTEAAIPSNQNSFKVLILGGSGKTGKETIRAALKKGYRVRSVTRNMTKAAKFEEGDVEWLEGTATDPELLKKAIQGQDAIISTIGPDGLGKTTLYSDSAKLIINAMKDQKVKRFVGVTADTHSPTVGWLMKFFVNSILLRNVLQDMDRMENIFSPLKDEDIEWTIVRPYRLMDLPYTGQYKAGLRDHDPPFKPITYRSDLGDFLANEVVDKKWMRQFVSLGM